MRKFGTSRPSLIQVKSKGLAAQLDYWNYRDAGQIEKAHSVLLDVQKAIDSLSESKLDDLEIQVLSAGKGPLKSERKIHNLIESNPKGFVTFRFNQNPLFLIQKNGYAIVLKRTDLSIEKELAFKIADLTYVNAPITRHVNIDGLNFSARLYLSPYISFARYSLMRGINPMSRRTEVFHSFPPEQVIFKVLIGDIASVSRRFRVNDKSNIVLDFDGKFPQVVLINHQDIAEGFITADSIEGNSKPITQIEELDKLNWQIFYLLKQDSPLTYKALQDKDIRTKIESLVQGLNNPGFIMYMKYFFKIFDMFVSENNLGEQ